MIEQATVAEQLWGWGAVAFSGTCVLPCAYQLWSLGRIWRLAKKEGLGQAMLRSVPRAQAPLAMQAPSFLLAFTALAAVVALVALLATTGIDVFRLVRAQALPGGVLSAMACSDASSCPGWIVGLSSGFGPLSQGLISYHFGRLARVKLGELEFSGSEEGDAFHAARLELGMSARARKEAAQLSAEIGDGPAARAGASKRL